MQNSFIRQMTEKELNLSLNHNTLSEIATLSHKDTRDTTGQYTELVLVYGTMDVSLLDFEDKSPVIHKGTLREFVEQVEDKTGAQVRKVVYFD